MSGAGWGQTEHARKVSDSSRGFLSRIRDRMRPRHYHEVTQKEREKSGRKVHYSPGIVETARLGMKSRWLRLGHGILVLVLSIGAGYAGGLPLMVLMLMGMFVWVVAKSIWEAHHTELPEIEKKHIRLKFKR